MRYSIPALVTTALLATACAIGPPTEMPIPSIEFQAGGSNHRTLVVMLPGRGDRAETFVREGFEAAGEQQGFDSVMVDAHFGYYRKRNLIPRLHEDIILPAREAGYQKIWLLGISMGGFGSVLYAANHPDQVDGVILLAPYLGEQDVIDEITQAGGVANWDPAQSQLEDYEVAMWSWLRDVAIGETTTPLVLGYGRSDRLAENYTSLVEELDPSQVYTAEGGHTWNTWKPLWSQIAESQGL
jgi:pimeloyl-ACP methyl ester carboxylesterase